MAKAKGIKEVGYVDVVADARLKNGGCILETEVGIIDAELLRREVEGLPEVGRLVLREVERELTDNIDMIELGEAEGDASIVTEAENALKALKKKMQREGIFREMKLRGHYEKPSEKRAREQAEAVRRARKLARKKMQREGLLPVKAKPAAR